VPWAPVRGLAIKSNVLAKALLSAPFEILVLPQVQEKGPSALSSKDSSLLY
jgi:hypothetical protein